MLAEESPSVFNRRFIFLFLWSLVLVCTLPLFSPLGLKARSADFLEPAVNISYRYYPISGRTASELRSQMTASGPRDRVEGRSYDANVDWAVRWSFRFAHTGSQCRMGSVSTQVAVTYTLPKWTNAAAAERSLVADWHRYLAALHRHEDGHKTHGVSAGREVLQTLRQLPSSPSCQELEKTAQATAQAIIRNYNQKDLEYDRVTRHGYTQGAVFPPTVTVSQ